MQILFLHTNIFFFLHILSYCNIHCYTWYMTCIVSEPDPGFVMEMCVYNDTIPPISSGYIISKNYPDIYDPDLDCTLFLPGTGLLQTLVVYVEAFHTEQDFDFLSVTHALGTSVYHGDGTQDDTAMIVGRNYTCEYTQDIYMYLCVVANR